MNLVTLTTDFGNADWFVGTMKGVILAINRHTTVVDISHEIPPGDIRAGAFALAASCRYFAKQTVHLAVVDPGVGTARKAIAVRTAKSFFVGPDNGVLSWALHGETVKEIRSLDVPRQPSGTVFARASARRSGQWFLHPVSQTFHGRDLFAPAAAHLSRGLPMAKLGRELHDLLRLPWPQPTHRDQFVEGEVNYLDRFGNAITNIAAADLAPFGRAPIHVQAKGKRLCPLRETYGSVPIGQPVAVLGSTGYLEIAVNGGSAARRLGLRVGMAVAVTA